MYNFAKCEYEKAQKLHPRGAPMQAQDADEELQAPLGKKRGFVGACWLARWKAKGKASQGKGKSRQGKARLGKAKPG